MPATTHTDRPPATGINRHIPNLLVVARLIMTAVMIAVLSIYRFPDTNAWTLPLATALFIIAALTDALDGYLARKWNAVSVFGRIMDPTADKILVLGAFVMLAGPSFSVPRIWDSPISVPGLVLPPTSLIQAIPTAQVSGVLPWMVVVILARELLVTALRGTLESQGIEFSASITGKFKMIAQSVGVPAIMLYTMIVLQELVILADLARERFLFGQITADQLSIEIDRFSAALNFSYWFAFLITLITALSAIPYITRARAAFKSTP